jgi:mRNA interferase MazF
VWKVNFDDLPGGVTGSEIAKERPAVIVSSDAAGVLPVKLVVPLTGWQPSFGGHGWHVRIAARRSDGISKDSASDVLQLRCVAEERFRVRLGRLTSNEMAEIAAAVALVVEFEPA